MGDGIAQVVTTTLDPTSYARGLRDDAAMLDMDRQAIRLHAGEMTPAEMRTVMAVLGWKRREIEGRADGHQGRSRANHSTVVPAAPIISSRKGK